MQWRVTNLEQATGVGAVCKALLWCELRDMEAELCTRLPLSPACSHFQAVPRAWPTSCGRVTHNTARMTIAATRHDARNEPRRRLVKPANSQSVLHHVLHATLVVVGEVACRATDANVLHLVSVRRERT